MVVPFIKLARMQERCKIDVLHTVRPARVWSNVLSLESAREFVVEGVGPDVLGLAGRGDQDSMFVDAMKN